jgi:capsular polysaccharide biosynthesis protein
VNTDPISPKKPLIMTAALLFGLTFAVVLALVRDVLDHTLRSAHDLQRDLGLKPLGSLVKF